MIKQEDLVKKVNEDEDFINMPKYENSIEVFQKKHPDGAKDDGVIAKALMMSENELKQKFDTILENVRDKLKIEDI
jgi:LPS sulfotransferase NodH